MKEVVDSLNAAIEQLHKVLTLYRANNYPSDYISSLEETIGSLENVRDEEMQPGRRD